MEEQGNVVAWPCQGVCPVDCVGTLSCQNSGGARVGPVWRPRLDP